LSGAEFNRCEFEHLELLETEALIDAKFIDCRVRAVTPVGGDDTIFAPELIGSILQREGAQLIFQTGEVASATSDGELDWELTQVGRLFRAFMRSTELNEGTISMKLGSQWAAFERSVLPRLLEVGIVREVPYLGHGVQRRFRLGLPLRELQTALERCEGDFEKFAGAVDKRRA